MVPKPMTEEEEGGKGEDWSATRTSPQGRVVGGSIILQRRDEEGKVNTKATTKTNNTPVAHCTRTAGEKTKNLLRDAVGNAADAAAAVVAAPARAKAAVTTTPVLDAIQHKVPLLPVGVGARGDDDDAGSGGTDENVTKKNMEDDEKEEENKSATTTTTTTKENLVGDDGKAIDQGGEAAGGDEKRSSASSAPRPLATSVTSSGLSSSSEETPLLLASAARSDVMLGAGGGGISSTRSDDNNRDSSTRKAASTFGGHRNPAFFKYIMSDLTLLIAAPLVAAVVTMTTRFAKETALSGPAAVLSWMVVAFLLGRWSNRSSSSGATSTAKDEDNSETMRHVHRQVGDVESERTEYAASSAGQGFNCDKADQSSPSDTASAQQHRRSSFLSDALKILMKFELRFPSSSSSSDVSSSDDPGAMRGNRVWKKPPLPTHFWTNLSFDEEEDDDEGGGATRQRKQRHHRSQLPWEISVRSPILNSDLMMRLQRRFYSFDDGTTTTSTSTTRRRRQQPPSDEKTSPGAGTTVEQGANEGGGGGGASSVPSAAAPPGQSTVGGVVFHHPDASVLRSDEALLRSNDNVAATVVEPLCRLRGMDVFSTDHPEGQISKQPLLIEGGLRNKPTFVINIMAPWANLVLYFELPSWLRRFEDVREEEDDLDDVRALKRFLKGDDEYRWRRWKILPCLVDGPMPIKMISPPKSEITIGGKSAPLSWHQKNESIGRDGRTRKALLEVDCDLTSNKTVRSLASMCRRYVRKITIDLAMIVSKPYGSDEEEPSACLGLWRFDKIDLKGCAVLPEKTEAEWISEASALSISLATSSPIAVAEG